MFGIAKANKDKPSDLKKYIYDEYVRVQALEKELEVSKQTIEEKNNQIKEYEATRVVIEDGQRRVREKEREIDILNNQLSYLKNQIERLKEESGKLVYDKRQVNDQLITVQKELRDLKLSRDNGIKKAVSDATPQIEKDFLKLIVAKIEGLPSQTRKNGVLDAIKHFMGLKAGATND